MSHLARHTFSFVEYVALEAESPIKHEFLDGVVYAMAGEAQSMPGSPPG